MTLEPILKRVLKYSFGNIRRRTTDIIGQGGELPQSTRSDKIEINTELVSRALKYRITDIKTFEFIRHAGEKRGFYVILISRLLPFISFDIISCMAGLTGIQLGPYDGIRLWWRIYVVNSSGFSRCCYLFPASVFKIKSSDGLIIETPLDILKEQVTA